MNEVKTYVVDCNFLSSGQEVARDVDVVVVLLSDYNELYTSRAAVKHNLVKIDKDKVVLKLQEELQRVNSAFNDLASCVGFSKTRLDQTGDSPMDCANQLQQRLTTAEKYVQRLVNCSKNQDSIATGYLSDILDVIKGNNV